MRQNKKYFTGNHLVPVLVQGTAAFATVEQRESIYSPKANDTIDFHRLSDAVVIMDEPQTINPRYWHGFGETLQYLSDKLHTSYILMTVTQPYIIKGRLCYTSLIITITIRGHTILENI